MSFFKNLFKKQPTQVESPQDEVNVEIEEIYEQEDSEEVEKKELELEIDAQEATEEVAEIEGKDLELEIEEQEVTEEVEEKEPELEIDEQQIEELVEDKTQSKKKGFFSKLVEGLAKTRDNILGSVDDVLKGFKKIDEELYEELEEALIVADFGVETSLSIMEQLRKNVKEKKLTEPLELKQEIKEIITNMLTKAKVQPMIEEGKPNVVLVIGVNGVGKTTTIGKIAYQLQNEHKKTILAAADTFRAAAIEQLQIWANRAGVDLIKHGEGSDPAAVVYDAIQAAKARHADVLICDTAGRLQNKVNLMKELEKIFKIIEREYPEAHKEVLIVLDATTGQNALQQVKVFKEAASVDGIILTKLDGTAKGGAIVGICNSLNVPVKYIGVGEKIEDLQPFDPNNFAKALFLEN